MKQSKLVRFITIGSIPVEMVQFADQSCHLKSAGNFIIQAQTT